MVRNDEETDQGGTSCSAVFYSWYVQPRVFKCISFPTALYLAIWQYQSLHGGTLPDSRSAARELETIANSLISTADVNKQVLTTAPQDLIE